MLTVSRYFQNLIYKDNYGQRYLSSWSSINPDELRNSTDIPVVLQENSRLDKLANVYLGDSKYWWAICMNNGLKHFWDWTPNQTIYVPTKMDRFFIFIRNNI
jgi:hypothetical protein